MRAFHHALKYRFSLCIIKTKTQTSQQSQEYRGYTQCHAKMYNQLQSNQILHQVVYLQLRDEELLSS